MPIEQTITEQSIAWRILTARRQAKLSQSQLAAMIFVSEDVVSDWERGKYEPRLGEAGRIAIATGKDLNYLHPEFV